MGAFTDISSALSARLATLTDSPVVAWRNAKFKRAGNIEFLAEFLLPADTEQAALGDTGINEDIGTYQVNVNIPKDVGSGRAYDIADAIADHFARGLVLTSGTTDIRITGGSIGTELVDDIFYMIPVKIRYQTFTQPR